jgi:ABC-type branched-subunit amino acid transport system ATPase component/branched-subunit amino acid ABC-type transport system permease component
LVLIHRGSAVVNFAQAAVGLVGAYVFYEARVEAELGESVALALGVATSALIGALFYALVIRRMRDASMLTGVVSTLALLVVLQGVAILRYGPQTRVVPSILPIHPFRIGSITVGADRIWIFGIVITLTLALWAVYRSTTFGIATTAVAENPRAAAALSVSPHRIAVANWAIGSALGGLAAILLVPITGLGSANLTWLVIPVLAAAVVGRFSSFPLTVVGGVAIGVAQSLVTRYVETPGAGTAVPFVLATVVLLLRGTNVAAKNERFGRMPRLGSGRVAPVPLAAGCAAVLVCAWWLFPSSWTYALLAQLIVAIVLMSFVVVTGFAGQISLAQFAFAGFGAMGASWLMFHHGWPWAAALVGGALLTAPVGIVIGLAGVRTRGVDLAILTLGLAIAMPAVVLGNPHIMRRVYGRTDRLDLFGIDIAAREHPERYATVALGVLVVVLLGVTNLRRSRAGRRLIAVRTNERAAAAMGISVVGAKLYAFVLGGIIAGLGGVLFAFQDPIPRFGEFSGLRSIDATQFAVLGGVGTVGGPLVGSLAHPDGLGQRIFVFMGIFGDNARSAIIVAIIANVALLAMLTVSPDGVAVLCQRAARRFGLTRTARQPVDASAPAHASPAAARSTGTSHQLRVEHLTVWFGGTCALDDFSMVVDPGEVVGVIGPNGAGKSTAIEAITGFVRPRSGSVVLGNSELGDVVLDRKTREQRARAGMARSFQSLELFDDLTVLENVQAACDRRDLTALVTNLFVPGHGHLTQVAAEVVADFGLESVLATTVSDLSYAQRRMLSVARAIAGGQSVLLLDEPAAGLDSAQTQRLGQAIKRLAAERGVAVVLVEHNVDMVLRTCDRVYALEFGRTIGHGTPHEIACNAAVIEAYLGARHAVSH